MKKKLTYIEPSGYITPEMKKILEKGEKNSKTSVKNTKTKKTSKK